MIQLLQECRSNEGFQPIEVESHTQPGVFYVVLTASWLAPQEYICDCEGYRFRAKCRHQHEALAKLCRWTELEGPEKQTPEQKRKLVCPRCQGMTRRVMEEIDE